MNGTTIAIAAGLAIVVGGAVYLMTSRGDAAPATAPVNAQLGGAADGGSAERTAWLGTVTALANGFTTVYSHATSGGSDPPNGETSSAHTDTSTSTSTVSGTVYGAGYTPKDRK